MIVPLDFDMDAQPVRSPALTPMATQIIPLIGISFFMVDTSYDISLRHFV